jgi:hypothetical protein
MAAIGAFKEHLKQSNVLDQNVMALVVEACNLAKQSKQSNIIEFKAKKNRTAVLKLYVELAPPWAGGVTTANPESNNKKAGLNVSYPMLRSDRKMLHFSVEHVSWCFTHQDMSCIFEI